MTLRNGALSGALLLTVLVPSAAHAQFPELPTLEGMGVEYISRSGFFQLLLSGRLDLEAVHRRNDWDAPVDGLDECNACHVEVGREMQEGSGWNELHRLRVFADVFLGDHLYSLVELRADRGRETWGASTRMRVDQAFVRAVTGSGTEGVQVGRFSSPFGSYQERHLTDADPFLTPPLPYGYRTVMNRWRSPGSAAAFSTWKDNPQDADLPGAPPVWDVPYQWGAMVFGRVGPVDLRAAAMNSAPSSHPNAWNLEASSFERPSWVVGARWAVSAALEVGASWDRGPWLAPQPTDGRVIVSPPGAPVIPPPTEWRDFDQEVISVDLAFLRGPIAFRAEALRDRWEVPNVDGMPTEFGYTAELQSDLSAGLFAAARWGYVDFRPLDGAEWDHDVQRFEVAAGYRLSRNVGLRASAYRQLQSDQEDADTDFFGLRLWWAF